MSPDEAAGLCLALASAVCLDVGFLWQHGSASRLPALSLSRPLASLRSLFGNLRWLAGFAVGIAGWALYVGALRLAPLSLVQAVAAGGIGLLALLVELTTDVRLSRREWAGVAAAGFGLVTLGLSLTGAAPSSGHHASAAAVAAWVVASFVVAGLACGPGAAWLGGGAGFGLAAGTLYAAGDVGTKAAVAGGAAVLFTAVVLACHGLAFVALQFGFQRGGAMSTAGVSTLATNALPIFAGALLFGEAVPAGPVGVLRLLAFAAVIVGAALLTRGEPVEAAPETVWPSGPKLGERAAG